MKAIILAAGRGSRMKGLTDDYPKCFIKYRGKPLIEWQLEAIRNSGISEIAIVTGYKNEFFNDFGLKLFFNEDWSKTQMVTSLLCASEWLYEDNCIVSYSDIFYDKSAIELLVNSKTDIAITYDPNWLDAWKKRFGDPLEDAESFKLNTDGSLADIGMKPKTIREIQGQYMGLLKFSPKGSKWLSEMMMELKNEIRDKMHMTSALQRLIKVKRKLIMTYSFQGFWGEVDTPNDLDVYQ